MKINRESFLNDLEAVKSGLSTREFIEQSSCFCFQDGMVMTFNDEVACRKAIGINLTGAIQAVALLQILEKMDDPELLVRENEKGELEFRGKRKGFGVTKDAEIFLPMERVETPETWKPLPPEFTEAVGLVQHCVSGDESRFLLTCVHIHPNFVEACDNLQIMRVKVKTGIGEATLIRGSSIKHITSLGMSEISITKSWLHFRNQDGLIFSVRRYAEQYPDLKAFLQTEGHPITIPKGMAEAASRAAVFATDKSGEPQVSVSLKPDGILIEGEGLSGWYREAKKVAYDGPPMKFLISPDLLKYVSEKYSDAIIGEKRLKVSSGGWQYVTVLGTSAPKKKKVKEEDDEEEEVKKPAKKVASKPSKKPVVEEEEEDEAYF